MSRNNGAVALLLAVIGVSLVGCTGSDPLNSGNNGYQVLVTPSANTTHFGTMIFSITGIQTVPADPQAQQVLGSDAFTLTPGGGLVVDFNNPFDQSNASSIPVGTYMVNRISITGLTLRANAIAPNPAVCEDFIVGLLNTGGVFNLSNFAGDSQFTVTQSTPGELAISVDAAALRDAVYAGVNCGNCNPANCHTQVPVNPNCRCFQIGGFSATPFRNLSDTWITVQ